MSNEFPPPPPPPARPNALVRAWRRFRGWPIWAQLLTAAVIVIVIAASAAGSPDEADQDDASPTSTAPEVESEEEAEESTTTSETTTTSSTTTTTEVTLTPQELRTLAVLGMEVVFEEQRDTLADTLDSISDVETVDRLVFENETVIVDITSGWASPDNQHDGAWNLMKGISQFWESGEGIWYQEAFVPNLTLINSGRTYACTGEFMVEMASLNAGRSAWETECT